MKGKKAITLVFLLVLSLSFSAASTGISTCQELQDMSLDGDYHLENDIDCSDTEDWNGGDGFEPIGDDSDIFTGSFDGQDYEITGLTIDREDEDYVGLFGYVAVGIVESVGVENASITGDGEVGGLVGYNYFSGKVSESYATGDVTGEDSVGGLVGSNWAGDVSESYATGDVTGDENVGGLVGRNREDVSESYWDVESSGQSSSSGGAGLTTDEMQGVTPSPDGDDTMDAFDFTDTWKVVEEGESEPFTGNIEGDVEVSNVNFADGGEGLVNYTDQGFIDGDLTVNDDEGEIVKLALNGVPSAVTGDELEVTQVE